MADHSPLNNGDRFISNLLSAVNEKAPSKIGRTSGRSDLLEVDAFSDINDKNTFNQADRRLKY
jgi:hypothetical protein